MEPQKRAIRVDDVVWERFLAVPGKTLGDKLLSLLDGQSAPKDARIDELLDLMRKSDTRTTEILELVQSQPGTEDVQAMFDDFIQTAREAKAAQPASDPRVVPGVQQGYAGLGKPRYESRADRAARERQEKMDAARARSSVGDDPNYTFDPEYVQD